MRCQLKAPDLAEYIKHPEQEKLSPSASKSCDFYRGPRNPTTYVPPWVRSRPLTTFGMPSGKEQMPSLRITQSRRKYKVVTLQNTKSCLIYKTYSLLKSRTVLV